MKNIAHRGNATGPKPELENSPAYILDALYLYEVEVDAWYISRISKYKHLNLTRWGWYLGHDEPTYWVPESFLEMDKLWIHIKNLEGMRELAGRKHNFKNYFWHENDQCARTSAGYLWTCDYNSWSEGYITRGILMKDDLYCEDIVDLGQAKYFEGICSDYVGAKRPKGWRFRS
jgi:hypothetical protein